MQKCKHGIVEDHCSFCTKRRYVEYKEYKVRLVFEDCSQPIWLRRSTKVVKFL